MVPLTTREPPSTEDGHVVCLQLVSDREATLLELETTARHEAGGGERCVQRGEVGAQVCRIGADRLGAEVD